MDRRLFQAVGDKGEDELLETVPGGIRDVAEGSLPGEHCQPVHRRPDGVLDAVATPPVEYAGVAQFVEDRAELTQGRAVRPVPSSGAA
jgi:hypothetical protein